MPLSVQKPHQSVIILGGNGFVGSHLIAALQKLHQEIHIISRQHPSFPLADNVHHHCASLDDAGLLETLLPKTSTIFHLACESTPGSSALKPVFEGEHNVMPTLRFLEQLQKHPKAHLVYLSTGGAIYGNPGPLQNNLCAIRETAPLMPPSYYGAGKAAVEAFIIAFCQQQQRGATILRPANFYGPGQPVKPEFGIIPTIFNCLLKNKSLSIWGDGETIRDYIYIEDFIELCILISTSEPIAETNIYNVGSGQGYSINSLCGLIEKITDKSVTREYHPSRTVDVHRVVLDSSHIEHDHAWRARTDLETGLAKTWKWLLNTDLQQTR
jgi:UDP-glucose 4-epimerase